MHAKVFRTHIFDKDFVEIYSDRSFDQVPKHEKFEFKIYFLDFCLRSFVTFGHRIIYTPLRRFVTRRMMYIKKYERKIYCC